MNNWRLLLLAVVVVVQPIGSFTESNLIDGRECCERSEDAGFYGTSKTAERRSPIDGIREVRRLTNAERRLSALDGNRERLDQARRGPVLTHSKSLEGSARRNSPQLSQSAQRFTSNQERYRDNFAQSRKTREDQNRNRDEFRNSMVQNERDYRESRNRNTVDASRTTLSRDTTRNTRSVERESRNTMSRLPIRTSRSIEERRESPNRETSILKREREDLIRADTRGGNLRASAARFESRIQLDDKERRAFDRRTREGHSRISNARVNDELRAERTQIINVELNERNNRDSRVELRGQRDTELRDRVSASHRASMRISADRMRESRHESASLVRGMDNSRIDERRQQRDDSRRSMDTLQVKNTPERRLGSRETSAPRSLEITASNGKRMEQRQLSMDRLLKVRESRDIRLSRVLNRESIERVLAERRQENREARDSRNVQMSRNYVEVRSENPERRQENGERDRDSRNLRQETRNRGEVRSESFLADRRLENRETRDSRNIRAETRNRGEVRSESFLSDRRQDNRETGRDLRNVREETRNRGEVRSESFLADRRQENRETARDSRNVREETRNRGEVRSESFLADRRQENRETRDSRNVREETRHHSEVRSEIILAARRLENREATRDSRSVRGAMRSERVLAERRQENREATRDSRSVRGAMRSEKVLAERRQENREATRDLRSVRGAMRSEKVLAERRQENHESDLRDSRDVTRLPGEFRNGRVLADRRQEHRQATRDSRNARGEIRIERLNSRRRRDATKELRTDIQRKSRDTERLTERFRESTSRLETRRKIEKQVQFDRSLRTADARRVSRSDIRASYGLAMERMNREASHLTKDVRDDAKRDETRFRDNDAVALRDALYSSEKSTESVSINWQTIFYTLQGIYLCGLLLQLLTENANKSKKRYRIYNWWSSKNLIKVD